MKKKSSKYKGKGIFKQKNNNEMISPIFSEPLTKIIESIIDEKKLVQSASSVENASIQQMALMAVKLLSKQLKLSSMYCERMRECQEFYWPLFYCVCVKFVPIFECIQLPIYQAS